MPKRGTPERPKIIKCVDCTFDLSISVSEDIGDSQLNEFILLQSWSPPEIKLARPGMGFRYFPSHAQNHVALFISRCTFACKLVASPPSTSLLVLSLLRELVVCRYDATGMISKLKRLKTLNNKCYYLAF